MQPVCWCEKKFDRYSDSEKLARDLENNPKKTWAILNGLLRILGCQWEFEKAFPRGLTEEKKAQFYSALKTAQVFSWSMLQKAQQFEILKSFECAATATDQNHALALLECGYPVTKETLSLAKNNGLVKVILKLVALNHPVIKQNPSDLLTYACKDGHLELVNKLLDIGTRPREIHLSAACEGEQPEIAGLLIEKGCPASEQVLVDAVQEGLSPIAYSIFRNIKESHNDKLPQILGRALFYCNDAKLAAIFLKEGADLSVINRQLNVLHGNIPAKLCKEYLARLSPEKKKEFLEMKDLDNALPIECEHDEEVASLLIEAGSPLKNKDTDFEAILDYAHSTKFIKSILKVSEEQLSVFDDRGNALHYALFRLSEEAAALLIDKGIDVTLASSRDKETALHIAAKNGLLNTVGKILSRVSPEKKQALLDAQDVHGATALLFACEKGFEELAIELVQMGAAVTIGNNKGINIGILAVVNGLTRLASVCQKLYPENPPINSFLAAIASGDLASVKQELEKIPAENRLSYIDSTIVDNRNGLMWAAYKNQTEIVRLLVEQGADCSVVLNNTSVLHLVNDLEIAKLLLQKIPKEKYLSYLRLKPTDGYTPLRCAVMKRNAPLVEFWMEAQVDRTLVLMPEMGKAKETRISIDSELIAKHSE